MKISKKKTAVIFAAALVVGLHAFAGAEVLKEVDFKDYSAAADADNDGTVTAAELNALTDAGGNSVISITEAIPGTVTYKFEQDEADTEKTWLTVENTSNVSTGITLVEFPFIEANGYELNNDDRLIVEYELRVNSPVYELAQVGSVGLVPVVMRAGGNKGYVQYNVFYGNGDTRNTAAEFYKVGTDGAISEYAIGPELKVSMDFDCETSEGKIRVQNIEGTKNHINITKNIAGRDLYDLRFSVGARANSAVAGSVSIANVKIYTIPKLKAVSLNPENGEEGVYPTSKTVSAVFTNAINPSSLSGISIYANGSKLLGGYTAVLDAADETNKTVLITFDNDLEKSTTYKIDYSALTDAEYAQSPSGTAEYEFRTEEIEDVVISGFRVIQGADSGAAAGNEFSKGALNGAEIKVLNNSANDASICVILAIYDAENRLTDTAISQTDVAAGEETTVTTGMTLDAGGSVKVFTWNGITTMKPWDKSIVNTINE